MKAKNGKLIYHLYSNEELEPLLKESNENVASASAN